METNNHNQQKRIDIERGMEVFKRNDIIQKSRFTLSIQEQRIVLFAISKIQPDDNYLTEYTFKIKDFYALCGLGDDSYTRLKAMLLELKKKACWMLMEDGKTESAVSWFDVVRISKHSGMVTVAFHRDMMPYLFQLAKQEAFYTKYSLQNILPMRSQYAPRLYEILKSYQFNNVEWRFDLEKLKHLLDCVSYERFPDFKRRVLDPSVKEINEYTDINISYEVDKQGRKTTGVTFYMRQKTKTDAIKAQIRGKRVLDGQLSIEDILENARKADLQQEGLEEDV